MKRLRLADLAATAEFRAAGYLDAVRAAGTVSGEYLELSEEAFARLRAQYAAPALPARWPRFARLIARRRTPADSGVGDTIARVIGPLGGDAFKTWFERWFGRPCKCAERQDELNHRFPYVPSAAPVDAPPLENGAVRSLH